MEEDCSFINRYIERVISIVSRQKVGDEGNRKTLIKNLLVRWFFFFDLCFLFLFCFNKRPLDFDRIDNAALLNQCQMSRHQHRVYAESVSYLTTTIFNVYIMLCAWKRSQWIDAEFEFGVNAAGNEIISIILKKLKVSMDGTAATVANMYERGGEARIERKIFYSHFDF